MTLRTQTPICRVFLERIVIAGANCSIAWCGSAPTLHWFVGILFLPHIAISRFSGLLRSPS